MKGRLFNAVFSRWLITGIISMILVVGVPAQTSSPQIETQTSTIATNEVTPAQEDFWTAGQSVEIKPEGVKGDVVVAGASVKVSGKVQGYLMAAGANVNVDAPIGNDLWAAGATVNVTAPVADNAMLAGSTVTLAEAATIGKDARIAASFIDVKSRVTRNLEVAAANAQISSEIGGNLTAHVESLTLNPGAVVRGDLTVYSPNQPLISDRAQVLGRIDYHKVEPREHSTGSTGRNLAGSWVLGFLWLTVLGLAAIGASSVWTNRVAEMLKNEPGYSLLAGLVATILIPIVFLILLLTVLGVPLAFVLGAFYLIGFILSGVFVSYLFGDWILRRIKRWENSNVAKILVGALVVSFFYAIPLVGFLAQIAVLFFGFGALLLERRDFFRQMRAQGLA